MFPSNLLRRMAGCHRRDYQVFQMCQRGKSKGLCDSLCTQRVLIRDLGPESGQLLSHLSRPLEDLKGIR